MFWTCESTCFGVDLRSGTKPSGAGLVNPTKCVVVIWGVARIVIKICHVIEVRGIHFGASLVQIMLVI